MQRNSSNNLRVLFAGGGTGGHLYPALAIANGLVRMLAPRSCEIIFVGSKRGIEYRKRKQLGYPLELIPVRPLLRRLTLKNLLFPFALCGALLRSNAILADFRPDLVVGTGGYVSGPVVSRAIAKNILCAIQEQNSYPGLTTRKLASKVDRVYLGFEDARTHLPEKAQTLFTGNPVRSEIGSVTREAGYAEFKLDPEKSTILILGGSQGARSINQSVLNAINGLSESAQILWQTGVTELESVREALANKPSVRERVRTFAFTDKIECAYACADIAIARAGALTIAELQAAELPALLIPYPAAAGDHQRKNAESVTAFGSAEMILDAHLEKENPLERALSLLQNDTTAKMRAAWRERNSGAEKSAQELIVADLITLLESRGRIS